MIKTKPKGFGKNHSNDPTLAMITLINRMTKKLGYEEVLTCFIQEFTDCKKKRLAQLTNEETYGFLKFYEDIYNKQREQIWWAVECDCCGGEVPPPFCEIASDLPILGILYNETTEDC